jgi:hypothetical protein
MGFCTKKDDCASLDDICNVGTCVNGSCEKWPANDGTSCDDGLYCTESDACMAGKCVGGSTKFCPSMDACHVGACDEVGKKCGSAPGNDGGSCDDGDPCTYSGSCSGGVCSKGPPVDCSAFTGPCSTGICDPVLGCKAMPLNEGAACDDSLFCTINDTCKAGQCSGKPNPCAPPDDVCMIGTCNEAMKTCVSVPGNDGAACDDKNPCTASEKCSAGTCVGGVPANEGQTCDDANGCTSGTTCSSGICANAKATITQCVDGDQCCPAGCVNDKDCLYWQGGVQSNIAPAALVGWTQCYSDTYNIDLTSMLPTLLMQCSKAKLLLACRKVGAPNYQLAAMAPKADVLFACGSTPNCVHEANGVGWYFDGMSSWGFAPGGATVNRQPVDYDPAETSGNLRMSWYTSGGIGGFRCGDNSQEPGGEWLLFSSDWERVIFQAD